MRFIRLFVLLAVVTTTFGCAHRIDISPRLEKFDRDRPAASERIGKSVGIYMPAGYFNLQVTTPGGGGDKVTYLPYRSLYVGFQKMVENIFDKAIQLSSPSDQAELERNNITFVLTPDLTTHSGSSSLLTWPPTDFSIALTTKVMDGSGRIIASPSVVGIGKVAGFSEFRSDFGLSGRLAMEDALAKMQRTLISTKYDNSYAENKAAEKAKSAAESEARRIELAKLKLANLQREADAGSGAAQYELALFHLEKVGTNADEKSGLQWLAKAAEKGMPKAQFDLGVRYLGGNGVPKDEAKAELWLSAAAKGGSDEAKRQLAALAEIKRERSEVAERKRNEELRKKAAEKEEQERRKKIENAEKLKSL